MIRTTFMIAAVAFLSSAAAATPPVTVDSPCECHDAHGKARMAVKNGRQLRLRMQTRFKPSHLATSTVGQGRTYL